MFRSLKSWQGISVLSLIVLCGCAVNTTRPGRTAADYGAAIGGHPAEATPDTMQTMEIEPSPPPLIVPAGVDTTFAEAVDSLFGEILPTDSLLIIDERIDELAKEEVRIDSLISVLKFFKRIENPKSQLNLSENDSLVIGEFLLRAARREDREAADILAVDEALRDLIAFSSSADSLENELTVSWPALLDPGRQDDLRLALLAFPESSDSLIGYLDNLSDSLAHSTKLEDQVAFRKKMENLVTEFRDRVMGAAIEVRNTAGQMKPISLVTPRSLHKLAAVLTNQGDQLILLEAEWGQINDSGNLMLLMEQECFRPGEMETHVTEIRSLMRQAKVNAKILADSLAVIQTKEDLTYEEEMGNRKSIESFITDLREDLGTLRKKCESLSDKYTKCSRSRRKAWQNKERNRRASRDKLTDELRILLGSEEDKEAIRTSAEIRSSFLKTSNSWLEKMAEESEILKEQEAAALRVRVMVARHLYDRAVVLGDSTEYRRAAQEFEAMLAENTDNRNWDWARMLARLDFYQSRDEKISAAVRLTKRNSARQRFDDCLKLFQASRLDNNAWDDLLAEFTPEADADNSPAAVVVDSLLQLQVPPEGFYYERFFAEAWETELIRWREACQLPNFIDLYKQVLGYRRTMAKDEGDGDRYLLNYALLAHLCEGSARDATISTMRGWSWDEANLALSDRYIQVMEMPDSSISLAQAKYDSLVELIPEIRTVGVMRDTEFTLAYLEFEKLKRVDQGLDRLFRLNGEVEALPNPNPEIANIDSLIQRQFPYFLYNRALSYHEAGERRNALLLFHKVGKLESPLVAKALVWEAYILQETSFTWALDFAKRGLKYHYEALKGEREPLLDDDEFGLALNIWRNTAVRLGMTGEARKVKQKIAQWESMVSARADLAGRESIGSGVEDGGGGSQ